MSHTRLLTVERAIAEALAAALVKELRDENALERDSRPPAMVRRFDDAENPRGTPPTRRRA